MQRNASARERAYFRRAEELNRQAEESPPASLAELFWRLDEMRRRLGPLATPGREGEHTSELASHRRLYERQRELSGDGTASARRPR